MSMPCGCEWKGDSCVDCDGVTFEKVCVTHADMSDARKHLKKRVEELEAERDRLKDEVRCRSAETEKWVGLAKRWQQFAHEEYDK